MPHWALQRRYSEERREGEERCKLVPLGRDDYDPLQVTEDRDSDHGEAAESVEPDPLLIPETAKEDEAREGGLMALDDDDFDPLASGAADREPSTSEVDAMDPAESEEDDEQRFGGKFGGPEPYTPGFERKANWTDWRDRRAQLLNVRSFLDADYLAEDETLSALTVNLNFQVGGAPSATSRDASGVTSEQRLRALEEAIERKAMESGKRGRERTGTVMRNQVLGDQQEMVEWLRLLSKDLSVAWAKNQRVVAVKIAEKTADLLEKQVQDLDLDQDLDDALTISSLVFFPAIYVFACEILDTLGDLVWERIRRKCQYEDNGTFVRSLERVFTHETVREEAKYTCSNWFLKIAGNKSLVGRIYLEASLARCHHFLIGSVGQEDLHDTVFLRLAKMCRGVAHPLTSCFARMYVARRGAALLPDSSSFAFLDLLMTDALRVFKGLARAKACATKAGLHVLKLAEICLKYILETRGRVIMAKTTLSREAKFAQLKHSLRLITSGLDPEGEKGTHPSTLCLLQHFLRRLPHHFVTDYAPQLTQLVVSALEGAEEDQAHPHYVRAQAECFAHLGSYLGPSAKASDETVGSSKGQRRQVLNMMWRVVLRYTDLDNFLKVAQSFAAFVTSSFGDKEIHIFVQSVHKHVRAHLISKNGAKRTLGDHQASQIKEILLHLFLHYEATLGDLSPLFTFPSLTHLIDLAFPSNAERVAFAETTVRSLFYRGGQGGGALTVTDPLTQQFCLDMCQLVSDAIAGDINASWVQYGSRARQTGKCVCAFILSCDFGGNYESHLGFLCTCRRVFHKVLEVQELCVHLACQLACRILHRTCGGDPQRHTPATLDMAKACVAFCHITAPSLPGVHPKLGLMAQSASVALMNGLVSQAESLVRAGVTMAEEVMAEGGREEDLRQCGDFLKQSASLCLLLPGHPQKGPLFVVLGIERAMKRSLDKISLLPMICAMAQDALPYHCRGVDSNNVLYAGDEDFQRELQEMGGKMVAEGVQGLLEGDHGGAEAAMVLLGAVDTILTTCKCSAALVDKLRALLLETRRRRGGRGEEEGGFGIYEAFVLGRVQDGGVS